MDVRYSSSVIVGLTGLVVVVAALRACFLFCLRAYVSCSRKFMINSMCETA